MKKILLLICMIACSTGLINAQKDKRPDTYNYQRVAEAPSETESDESEDVCVLVEVCPEFPGGMDAFMLFFADNIRYPQNARKENIQGRVVLSAVIDEEGTVTNVKVTKSLHPDCDKEAVRVAYTMPKWKPGTLMGKPVKCRMTMPVLFKL